MEAWAPSLVDLLSRQPRLVLRLFCSFSAWLGRGGRSPGWKVAACFHMLPLWEAC